jgi:hypothetical protein
MVGVLTWWHTVRHLRPIQVYWRPWAMLKRTWVPIPGVRECARRAKTLLAGRSADLPPSVVFSFLNVEREYPVSGISWADPAAEKLWRYHLQYGEYLAHGPFQDDRAAEAMVLLWLAENADDRREAWEPFVVSRRIQAWSKRFLPAPLRRRRDPEFSEILREALDLHLRRLSRDIEYHVQGNHLLENHLALAVGALALFRLDVELGISSPRPCRLLRRAIRALSRSLDEQILTDGAHYERSPMYHDDIQRRLEQAARFVTETAAGLPVPEAMGLATLCRESARRMDAWSRLMVHPDGSLPQFGDSTRVFPENLAGSSPMSGFTGALLPLSGFFVARWGEAPPAAAPSPAARYPENFLVMNVGGPAPEYQPGHAHCDALSFELSLRGKRLIIDTGCGSYQHPEIRRLCRSTAAHNVPWREGSEQSDIWEAFRLGRRVQVVARTWDAPSRTFLARIITARGQRISRLVHFGDGNITFTDTWENPENTGVFESLLHVAPEVTVRVDSPRVFQFLGSGNSRGRIACLDGAEMMLETGVCYPDFGVGRTNLMIRCRSLSQSCGKEPIRYVITVPA